MEEEFYEIVESIKELREPIIKQLKKMGSTQKTIDLFFEGEEILHCPSCGTFNFIEADYNKLDNYSIYHCGNCLFTKIKSL